MPISYEIDAGAEIGRARWVGTTLAEPYRSHESWPIDRSPVAIISLASTTVAAT